MPPKEWPTQRVKLADVDPNPWNPNRMGADAMAKLRRAVEDEGLGILGHLVVRPKDSGRYELVDGEHRLRIYQDMGLEDVEAIVADLTDENAQVAGLVLNELRGRPSLPELGKVLGDLAASRPVADLAKVLPWREGVIKNLAMAYGGLEEKEEVPLPPPKLPRNAVEIRQGDARAVLKQMRPRTVQTVVTSPPYWGLRDYSRCACATKGAWEGRGHNYGLQFAHPPDQGGTLREEEPDPDCPRCHGTGRDDSMDLVWGGEKLCDHAWDVETIQAEASENVHWQHTEGGPSAGGKANRFKNEGRKADEDRVFVGVERATCRSCGAWKGQLGLEATLEAWTGHVVEVFRAIRRVLRDDGTAWLNMGFSYDGRGNLVDQATAIRDALIGDGWFCKSPVVWAKPNPMPASVTKRPTVAHEMVWLLAKDPGTGYFYDADAVREPSQSGPSDVRKMIEKKDRIGGLTKVQTDPLMKGSSLTNIGRKRAVGDPSGRNRRTVWEIATQGYPGAHFATFPEALVDPCIRAGTSEAGCCAKCGTPWVRLTELTPEYEMLLDSGKAWTDDSGKPHPLVNRQPSDHPADVPVKHRTLGFYQACTCDGAKRRPCLVLDPFMGSGTAGVVALGLGRRFLGVDLKEEYVAMAKARIARSMSQARR